MIFMFEQHTQFSEFVEYRLLGRAVWERHGVLPWRQEVVGRVAIEHSHQAFRVVFERGRSPDSDVELANAYSD